MDAFDNTGRRSVAVIRGLLDERAKIFGMGE